MDGPDKFTRSDVEGFSRAVKASRERAHALKHRAYSDDPTEALDHMQVVVEELSVADEELRTQTDALEQAHVELEDEKRRYEELFDSAPDPYIVTDLSGVIRRANRAASLFFSVPPQFLCGKPLAAFVALSDRSEFRTRLDHALESPFGQTWEVTLFGRDHLAATFELHVARAPSPGSADELRCLLRDVTQRREAEDQVRAVNANLEQRVLDRTQLLEDSLSNERAARARADTADRATLDFTTRLSHELRTPLQAAIGYVDIVSAQIHGPVNEAQREALQRVAHAHRHMLALVDSLLEIGRVRAGQVALHLRDVRVSVMLRNVEELITRQITEQGLTLSFVRDEADEVNVRADGTKLEQIIINLLSNALRYTRAGGHITVASSIRDAMVAIEVRDTGRGIPQDQLQAIFEPFVRVAPETAASVQGTGLGLAISRELARLMGGDITSVSEIGKGSTFIVTVPRAAT